MDTFTAAPKCLLYVDVFRIKISSAFLGFCIQPGSINKIHILNEGGKRESYIENVSTKKPYRLWEAFGGVH